MTDTSAVARSVIDELADLPLPGGGATGVRLARLFDVARVHPVGVARIVEAHTDAVAIRSEDGRSTDEGVLYGVWAADDPRLHLEYDPASRTVSGAKAFASGVGTIDRSLVTALAGVRRFLLDVAVSVGPDVGSIVVDDDAWSTSALADTRTYTVHFDRHPVDEVISGDGWYLDRPGFWHGACAPAACWAGGAAGLVDAVADQDDRVHRSVALGAAHAHVWNLRAALRVAGDDIDAAPGDRVASEFRARALRYTTERACTTIIDTVSRAFGPRPFVSDVDFARRAHDLHLYLRQHHGERELVDIRPPVVVSPHGDDRGLADLGSDATQPGTRNS